MHRPASLASCTLLVTLLHYTTCMAEVGVTEPQWDTPPTVYKQHHQLTVPTVEDVDDVVEVGNVTADSATVDIMLIGNGERLYGASGEAHRAGDGTYILPGDGEDACTLRIRVEKARVGIQGMPVADDQSNFCPDQKIWLPISQQ